MADNELHVFVGTYTEPILFGSGNVLEGKGDGIYAFDMDLQSGSITTRGTIEGIRNPSYLTCSSDSRFLLCVNELKDDNGTSGGTVSSLVLAEGTDTAPGRSNPLARRISTQPTDGADPCYLTLDRSGAFLFTANYMSGSVCVHPLSPTGELGAMSDFRQHRGSGPNTARQTGPHAHAVSISPDNRFVFVPDLGIDTVLAYEFDAGDGRLGDRPDLAITTAPGAGPRHLVFSPDGRFAYLINELNSTITSYQYDADAGQLSEECLVSTLPDDYTEASSGAHIAVSPCGRFVYGSNRGHDSIAVFRVEEQSGRLIPAGHCFSGGRCPRNFAIDPSGTLLVVANQDSDLLTVFTIDRNDGTLHLTDSRIPVPTPVCVVFTA